MNSSEVIDRIFEVWPAPFDWLLAAGYLAAWAAWSIFMRINRNLLELGWPWLWAYWIAMLATIDLAEWGRQRIGKTLAGNDVLEVRFAAWLGKPAAFMLRAYVAVPAWAATGAVVVGYGAAAMLLFVGVLWRWVAVVAGLWLLAKAAEVRRARLRRLRG